MHNVSIEALVERRVSRPIIARKKGEGARPPLPVGAPVEVRPFN